MYEEKEETATNTLTFDDSTFDLRTLVIDEDYTQEASEGGEYTYTDTTLTLNYFFHINAAGEPYYGDEVLNGLMDDRTILFGYVRTERGTMVILDVEGQLFIKQQVI
jgi:hypothetical protein